MFLKYWRNLRNLSIAELSLKSSVPIRTIEDIERRGGCKIDTAKKLAEALNINLYDLASDPDTFYLGKYAALDLTDVLKYLFFNIPSDDFARLLEDIHTYEHGIHVQAMNLSLIHISEPTRP